MIQVCSVCKEIYGEKDPYEDTRETHGYCPECFEIAMAELKSIPRQTAQLLRQRLPEPGAAITPNNGMA